MSAKHKVLAALNRWKNYKAPASPEPKSHINHHHALRHREQVLSPAAQRARTARPQIQKEDVELDDNGLPRPKGSLKKIFSQVKEVALSGGGGAGMSYPRSFMEAVRFGLDFKNIDAVCATSVGSIMGLGIVIGAPPHKLTEILEKMPTDRFQDWSLQTILSFFTNWGLCEGKFMPTYFREIIKEYTGLDDPSFKELYEKTGKEFRVIVSNVSRKKMQVLSHKTAPHMSVAEAVGLSCSVPLLFFPKLLPNKDGILEYYSDGGILKNYPLGVCTDPSRRLYELLGWIFMNDSAAYAMNDDGNNGIYNLFDYFIQLLTMAIFQDPFCLPDSAKARTVVISLAWNPLQFTSNEEEQKILDKAGKDGVRRAVKQILKSDYDIDIHELVRNQELETSQDNELENQAAQAALFQYQNYLSSSAERIASPRTSRARFRP